MSGRRNSVLTQPTPLDTVPGPHHHLLSCPPCPTWQSRASPASAASLLYKSSTDWETFCSSEIAPDDGRWEGHCPSLETVIHLLSSLCQGQKPASPMAVVLLQTRLASLWLHSQDAANAPEPFLWRSHSRSRAALAPALAPAGCREGAQGTAALKKEEEQREEENAKLAQWVDLLFKCS